MKITSLHIQKFRSINDATLRFEQVVAIVGANNSGKSHFLRALNAFFNFDQEKESFQNGDHKYSSQSRPKITVIFSEISPEDGIPDSLLDHGTFPLQMVYRWDRNNAQYSVIVGGENRNISHEQFELYVSHFKFVYIPITRDYADTFSTENGIIYSFLRDIFHQHTAQRNTIQPHISRVYQKLRESVLKIAVKKTKKCYPFSRENDFELKIQEDNAFDSIIKGITLILKEETSINDIKNCGSGIQSAVFLAISLAAAIDSDINYLIAIEEPEINMHPQAQRELLEALKDITKYPHSQFVVTTHSSIIIDKLGHQAIALCRKLKGETRSIVSHLTQVSDDFLQKNALEEFQYYKFFNFKNSDFFFSRYLVITESPTDCNVFIDLLKQYDLDPEKYDITFIPANGEANIRYPYVLAKELKIPFLCIVDKDVFLPYINQERNKSLNQNGFPEYKFDLKKSSFWWDSFSNSERADLLSYLKKGRYRKMSELLVKKHILSMNSSLEVDLIANDKLREIFYDVCDIPLQDRTPTFLLCQKSGMIKKIEILKKVLQGVARKDLPFSYRTIVSAVQTMVTGREAR